MARALQCPDCGHREPLDHLGDVEQFRCHGCGRALKVPPELRPSAPDGAGAGSADPVAPTPEPAPDADAAPSADDVRATRVLARAGDGEPVVAAGAGDAAAPRTLSRAERAAQAAAIYDRKLPLAARLAIWIVWLPIGLAATYGLAIKLDWINQDQLFDTVGEVTWDRFVPIGRVLPLAAVVVALLVHGSVLGLEVWAGRRRLRKATGAASAASAAPSA